MVVNFRRFPVEKRICMVDRSEWKDYQESLMSRGQNCSGIVVVDNNQNCNLEQSTQNNNCFRPSYSLFDIR